MKEDGKEERKGEENTWKGKERKKVRKKKSEIRPLSPYISALSKQGVIT